MIHATAALVLAFASAAAQAQDAVQAGLLTTFSSAQSNNNDSNTMILPGLAFYVPETQSPTAFTAPGKYKASMAGFVSSELRGEYTFQAELRGHLRLEINGALVLDVVGNGIGRTKPSSSVRLNKGTNALTASYTSPSSGDSFVRLYWSPKGGATSPVATEALSHIGNPAVLRASSLAQKGRELFIEYRCARCHQPAEGLHSSLERDSPSLSGVGSRLRSDWLADWLMDPKAYRTQARMPRLRHATAQTTTEMAAYLATLQEALPTELELEQSNAPENSKVTPAPAEDVGLGRQLFNQLHCIACHDSPESTVTDPERISLKSLALKFKPGMLAAFLQKPEGHFSWTRMPNFNLSVREAADLAAYLNHQTPLTTNAPAAAGVEGIARGKSLVQSTGCLSCHALPLENQFRAPSLSDLLRKDWNGGCLSGEASSTSMAPHFGFSLAEQEALRAFGTRGEDSLRRSGCLDSVQAQVKSLRCDECHGKFDGFPSMNRLAGKLRPEWAAAFISGRISYRARPWLTARMPGFPQYGANLAYGMAMLHGYPPVTPPEPPIYEEMATIGRQLVSAMGGLSCISCHAVGDVRPTQVFENEGINLALTHERLLKPYFQRWMRNPMAIDPVSKMPVFFDEQLQSVLTEVYEGDGAKQIEALWQYLRSGTNMPPPEVAPLN